MLLKNFVALINVFNRFYENKFLVAVSGGVDSVVLFDLCIKSNINFAVAHCNFQLRGKDSFDDEIFVQNLCTEHTIKFYCNRFIITNKNNIQERARNLRYNWFKEIIERDNFDYLLTAHNLNDNVETFFINILKGTGLKGLTGIPFKINKIIRPLLNESKADILKYAMDSKITFRQDLSNVETKYLRNKIRLLIIPEIEKIIPNVTMNIKNSISRFTHIESIYSQYVFDIKKQLFELADGVVKVSIKKLMSINNLEILAFEIFREFGIKSNQIKELLKLLHSKIGKFIIVSKYRFLIDRDHYLLISETKNEELKSQFFITDIPCELTLNDKEKLIFTVENSIDLPTINSKSVAYLNYKKIELPLVVRKWKEGDYFYPLGLNKKQKLKKFFLNNKFSIIDKERVWVIENNKKIIWIINNRIDDRYKIPSTPYLNKILKIVFQ